MMTCHLLSSHVWILKTIPFRESIHVREHKKDKQQQTHEEREVGRSERQDGERMSSWKRKLPSYLPAAEILEEEIQGSSPHRSGGNDAEERDQEDLLGAAKLWVRSAAAKLHASPKEGPRCPAPSRQSYLHDDVKGQVEQQVTDEDAQHVGGKVPGSIDQSKEGTEHTEELFCSYEGGLVTLLAFSLPHPHFWWEGNLKML